VTSTNFGGSAKRRHIFGFKVARRQENQPMNDTQLPQTTYWWSGPSDPNEYRVLWDPILEILAEEERRSTQKRIFDLGCGNGITAGMLSKRGYDVTGVDPSAEGLAIAKKCAPACRFHLGSAYDDLAARHGCFPIVICMEVIEHCYYPGKLAKTFYDLIADGGMGIMTTPYHGYLKNLALSVAGHWDTHFTSLRDGGHIKFFSLNTLGQILSEVGFQDVTYRRVGRIPPLAMAIIAVVRKS
jgi:SAM-dependent methyltransferase